MDMLFEDNRMTEKNLFENYGSQVLNRDLNDNLEAFDLGIPQLSHIYRRSQNSNFY